MGRRQESGKDSSDIYSKDYLKNAYKSGQNALKQALTTIYETLVKMEQGKVTTEWTLKMKTLILSLTQDFILQGKDDDAQLTASCCLADVMRLMAPESPFSTDEQTQDVFDMFIKQFANLGHNEHNMYVRQFFLLERLAQINGTAILADLGDDQAMGKLFDAFFSRVSERHNSKVTNYMLELMMPCIETDGSAELSPNILERVLEPLTDSNKKRSPVAYKLATQLIEKSINHLSHSCCEAFNKILNKKAGKEYSAALEEKKFEIIFELTLISPDLLTTVYPSLAAYLRAEDVDIRLEHTEMFAKLFCARPSLATQYSQVFHEYLSRDADNNRDIRAAVANTYGVLLKAGLNDERLRDAVSKKAIDPDEYVRKATVMGVCEALITNPECLSAEDIGEIGDRIRDKKEMVWSVAVSGFSAVFRKHIIEPKRDLIPKSSLERFGWIPGRILGLLQSNPCTEEMKRSVLRFIQEGCAFSDSAKNRASALAHLAQCMTASESPLLLLDKAFGYMTTMQDHVRSYLDKRRLAKEKRSGPGAQAALEKAIAVIGKDVAQDTKHASMEKLHMCKDNSIFTGLTKVLKETATLSDILEGKKSITSSPSINDKSGKKDNNRPLFDYANLLLLKISPELMTSDIFSETVEILGEWYDRYTTAKKKEEGLKEAMKAISSMLALISKRFPRCVDDSCDEIADLVTCLGDGKEFMFEEKTETSRRQYSFKSVLLQILSQVEAGVLKKTPAQSLKKLKKEMSGICQGVSSSDVGAAEHAMKILLRACGKGDRDVMSLGHKIADSINEDSLFEKNTSLLASMKSLCVLAQDDYDVFEQVGAVVLDLVADILLAGKIEPHGNRGSFSQPQWITQMKVMGIEMLTSSALGSGDESEVESCVSTLHNILVKKGVLSSSPKAEDAGPTRLAAAKALVLISKDQKYLPFITPDVMVQIARMGCDNMVEVASGFLDFLCEKAGSLKPQMHILFAFFFDNKHSHVVKKALVMMKYLIRMMRSYASGSGDEGKKNRLRPENNFPRVLYYISHMPGFMTQHDKTSAKIISQMIELLDDGDGHHYSFFEKLCISIKQADDKWYPEDKSIQKASELAMRILSQKAGQKQFSRSTYPGQIYLPVDLFAKKEDGDIDLESHLPADYDVVTATKPSTAPTARSPAKKRTAASPRKAKPAVKKPRVEPTRQNPTRSSRATAGTYQDDSEDDESEEEQEEEILERRGSKRRVSAIAPSSENESDDADQENSDPSNLPPGSPPAKKGRPTVSSAPKPLSPAAKTSTKKQAESPVAAVRTLRARRR